MFRVQEWSPLKSRGTGTQYLTAWALQTGLSSKPGSATQYGFCLYLRGDSGPATYASYMIVGKCLSFSELQFPHLQHGENTCTVWLWELSERMHVKCLINRAQDVLKKIKELLLFCVITNLNADYLCVPSGHSVCCMDLKSQCYENLKA